HELLTARPLFGAVSDFDTLSRVQFGAVRPPSSMNPHVTPELDAIVMKALAKEVGAGWPSGAAMREALLALPGARRGEVGDWVGEVQVERPPPGPLAQALARATLTDLVVGLVWGRPEPGPPTVELPDVPDVRGEVMPLDDGAGEAERTRAAGQPEARTASGSTVAMWKLERPTGAPEGAGDPAAAASQPAAPALPSVIVPPPADAPGIEEGDEVEETV